MADAFIHQPDAIRTAPMMPPASWSANQSVSSGSTATVSVPDGTKFVWVDFILDGNNHDMRYILPGMSVATCHSAGNNWHASIAASWDGSTLTIRTLGAISGGTYRYAFQ